MCHLNLTLMHHHFNNLFLEGFIVVSNRPDVKRTCSANEFGGKMFRPKTVNSSDMLPVNNTGSNKVIIAGAPYYWDRYQWVRDYQARDGEYDQAAICEDPENVGTGI